MAVIRPFQAWRPARGLEQQIAALPYDVYSREEASAVVAGRPLSFLRIDRPETQFDPSVSTYDDRVYEKARELLDADMREGRLVQDPRPAYYLYEQTLKGRSQTGLVACASIDDYESGAIKRHEKTRAVKEQDRIRHVDACSAQTGPIFLCYRNHPAVDALTRRVRESAPDCDFVSDGEVRNRVWTISDPADIEVIRRAFAGIDSVYIADGHHRCASAVRVGLKRRQEAGTWTGEEEFNYFLSVLFPQDQLMIMDYNRVLKTLNDLTVDEFLARLRERFRVTKSLTGQAKPDRKGLMGLYLGGAWYQVEIPEELVPEDPVAGLDVSILQDQVLSPLLGIKDPREDARIDFVGGVRGLEELERRVDSGECRAAFAMYPTSIEELFAVADRGLLMPPKSTWFEPKLLSGLFIHRLD